ncbi:MerR family transcriptional regulator [Umezawaea beigongshangensis]|uniref:MerR family transcriptional regulator n=1 Tax=Umezawaea beigongshangensis TaxID=2780383 RepID=UPI0018F17D27|nr:MerR family transcriptional regulator [Umezawaea beigongshangensis]
MGWSTRQLAELAGTTLRTIRHYHEVGLLAEPERRANGYKSYGVPHLVRVLHVKRLTGLGLSLAQVAELGDVDDHPREALRELDAELAATVEHLQGVRAELALVLDQEVLIALPPDVARVIADATPSTADRSFAVVLARLIAPEKLSAYAEALRGYEQDPVEAEFDDLPADADERTRQHLADRMRELPVVERLRGIFPDATSVLAGAPRGEALAGRTIGEVVAELYNTAQIDVLVRLNS